jgi:putative CocE/NonD family hydrolase
LRKLLAIAAGLAVFVLLLAGASYLLRYELLRWRLGLPEWTHEPGSVREVRVAMRDGVELATSVYEPAGAGPWPTVFIRNPYDADFIRGFCGTFVRFGYACVYQEARGQMDSGGDWEPMINEPNDGEDALAWLVAQPFHDGNVGFYGPSYLGSVQWAMASRGLPPEVKTMVPLMFGTDLYSLAYERGMFRHEILTAWSALMPARGFEMANSRHYRDLVRHRPHVEIDEQYLHTRLDWYRDYVTNPGRGDALWQRPELAAVLATPGQTRIPVLMIAGWYDIFLRAQLEDWQRLGSRARSKLVIGPWTHLMEPAGDLELEDARGGSWQWELVLDWMGHHLRGEPLDQPVGVVESYAIGEGRWRARAQWPPPSDEMRWHLDALADSQPCDGGRLSAEAPEREQQVSYTYDPDDPVPMRGGAGSLAFLLADGGPVHSVLQDGICDRTDVLSFTTPVLEAPLHIAGPIRVALSVSSDAPDTAFTAKLVEVRPDGHAFNVRDGITSLAYRDDERAAAPYEPGSVVGLELELWPIEWRVQPGSRLRLDVSSSNFPAYHAHPNRAGVWSLQADAVPARQTLHAGPAHEGWLALSVVAPAQLAASSKQARAPTSESPALR